MPGKDYYSILGISKDANQDLEPHHHDSLCERTQGHLPTVGVRMTSRKRVVAAETSFCRESENQEACAWRYRRAALKWHPDKNQAELQEKLSQLLS